MNRKNGACAGCDSALHLTGIDGKRLWLNVHEYRASPDIRDGPSGRNESKRDSDDFVSRSDTTGEKRQVQGTGSRVDANAVANTTVAREFGLESCDRGTRSKGALIKHLLNGLVNL